MKLLIRILRYALFAIIALELLWLVAGNMMLNTSLGIDLVNLKPQRFSMQWEGGWTLSPAHIHVNAPALNIHTRTTDITLKAEKVDGRIHILPLLSKHLIIDNIRGEVTSVVVYRGADRVAPPKSNKTKPAFKLELRDFEVSNLDEFSFNNIKMTQGQAKARGTIVIQPRANTTIENLHASWQQARVQLEEKELADSLNIAASVSSEPFNPRQHKGLALLEKFAGNFTIDGTLGRLAPLELLLPKAKWIESLDGEGEVDIHLVFDKGALRPGSEIDVNASDLDLRFLGFRASGAGRVDGSVVRSDGAQQSQLSIVFDQFDLARHDASEPLVIGEGLRLEVKAPELGPSIGLEDVLLIVDIPESTFPDITSLGSNLPESLGLQITHGSAVLKGHIEARGATQEVTGVIALSARSLKGRFRNMAYQMDMDINSQLSGRKMDDFRVELNGTELKLFNGIFDNGTFAVDDKWWMTISAPTGYAKLSSPAVIEADVSLAMRDTRAIITMLAEIKDWLRYFKNILTIKDVNGTAKIFAADQNFILRDVEIDGEKFKLLAEIEATEGKRDGIFWGKRGIFSLGVERIDQKNNWKLINGEAWYQKNKAKNWSVPDAESD